MRRRSNSPKLYFPNRRGKGSVATRRRSLQLPSFFRCRLAPGKERLDAEAPVYLAVKVPLRLPWYGEPNATSNAIGYASHYSRSHGAVIRVYDESGNVIETHEHAGDFKEP